MSVRLYLRASTKEQDASRAKSDLIDFAKERGLTIVATYTENISGASLQRPELFRLLNDANPGDILLCEQVDRLSRLTADDWSKLKSLITDKRVRVVSLDLPTSHMLIKTGDDFTSRMFDALNAMMLDMLAAISRKDYEDRRRRQAQGIRNAMADGRFKGRQENTTRNDAIMKMLKAGQSWNNIINATGCSRSTLARLAKRVEKPA